MTCKEKAPGDQTRGLEKNDRVTRLPYLFIYSRQSCSCQVFFTKIQLLMFSWIASPSGHGGLVLVGVWR